MLKYCIMTLEEEAEASMSIYFLNAGHMLCDCVWCVCILYMWVWTPVKLREQCWVSVFALHLVLGLDFLLLRAVYARLANVWVYYTASRSACLPSLWRLTQGLRMLALLCVAFLCWFWGLKLSLLGLLCLAYRHISLVTVYTCEKDFAKSSYKAFTKNTQKKETAVSEDTGPQTGICPNRFC